MTLYDSFIRQMLELLPDGLLVYPAKAVHLKNSGRNAVLFAKDSAYELGGSQLPCVSTMAVTSTMHFDNSVCVYGKDLFEIQKDNPFAKIVLLEIEPVDEDSAFDRIKELEQVRYSFCPEGFMTRASALSMREQIRVSKQAVKKQISFCDYGSALITEYLRFPIVKSVQIIFLTDFDQFDALYRISDKIKNTTSALNHILDNVLFDCASCNLKPICDEVEGMKELHMKKARM